MELLTLYAREEPPILRTLAWVPTGARDIALYRDAAATDRAGLYEWHRSDRPKRKDKTTMLNCYRWNVEWLPSL